MEDNNKLVFSLVVEYLSEFIIFDPVTYFNCLICSKIKQENILTWKPITTIFTKLPAEKRIIVSRRGIKIDSAEIVTRSFKTYLETVRSYCYLFNLIHIQSFKILGFVTNTPIEIIKNTTISKSPNEIQKILEINTYNINTKNYIHVKITEVDACALLFMVLPNDINSIFNNILYQMNFAPNSEIILGRNRIFADINLNVVHTTHHNWYIDSKLYFLSFITELPILDPIEAR